MIKKSNSDSVDLMKWCLEKCINRDRTNYGRALNYNDSRTIPSVPAISEITLEAKQLYEFIKKEAK